jgi:hypothetical protein
MHNMRPAVSIAPVAIAAAAAAAAAASAVYAAAIIAGVCDRPICAIVCVAGKHTYPEGAVDNEVREKQLRGIKEEMCVGPYMLIPVAVVKRPPMATPF